MYKIRKYNGFIIEGITIRPTHIDIKSSYKSLNIQEDNIYHYFIYLLYLSLDTEMNARISQVYQYLYEFQISNKDMLLDKLKLHKNWEYLMMLSGFNSIEFVGDCIKKLEFGGLLKITNSLIDSFIDKELNKNTKLLSFINGNLNSESDIYLFYEKFSEYFKKKATIHLEKFKYLIDEVVEDIKGNRPYNELYRMNF